MFFCCFLAGGAPSRASGRGGPSRARRGVSCVFGAQKQWREDVSSEFLGGNSRVPDSGAMVRVGGGAAQFPLPPCFIVQLERSAGTTKVIP